METMTHREMRNRSGEILQRVEAGESVRVSKNGHAAALIIPISSDGLDAHLASGDARGPRAAISNLSTIERTVSPISAEALVDDSRGRW